jgi:type I restriction enzyme S subunit
MIMTNNKDKKVLNVPNLRFPEFTEEWERCSLGHVTDFVKERISTDKLTLANYVSTENMKSDFGGINPAISIPNNTNVIHYKKGDVLLSNIRPYLRKVWAANSDGGCSTDVFVFRAKSISPSFLHYIMANDTFINYVMSGAKGVKMPRGDKEQMLKYVFSIPRIEEQYKISRLLHLLDDRIATQNKIIEDLKKLKSAICEKLFSSPKDKQPQIRLYGFFGDWHFVRLSDICHRICRKNTGEQCKQVLTIAAQYGLVSQEEFFNKNVASENLSGYYLLQKGDFAYNKSYSGDYVWGTVKRLDNYEQGVLSPLYICFRPDPARVDSDFLIYYFESKKWHKTVANIAGEGARNHGLLNISVVDYFNTIHCIPSMDEQKQIAQIIGTLLSKIAREQRMLNCYAAQRQYLLRQMFI